MNSSTNPSKEHTVSISSDNIYEAIARSSDAVYNLVLEALASHECADVEECQFETFARDLLGVLDRHTDYLSDCAQGSSERGEE